MNYLATTLRDKYPEDQLYILIAKRNSGSFTYDGIELGGERVTQEIEQKLEELANQGQVIKKLSVVGYSLGGLVARYAVGLLYHKGWFDRIEPVNFTTFVTPHLGVRTPLLGVHNHLWNVLGARTLSMSGRQLFMIDSFRDTGRPLLAVLAEPDSIFIKALGKFKHRSLYANVQNDRSVVYYTGSISRTDPFVNMNNIKVNYVEGYEPVILDGNNPVSPKDNESLPRFHERFAGKATSVFGKIPLIMFLMVFIPIGTTLFLLNAAVQSVLSRQRIREHHDGRAGIDIDEYSVPLMVEMVRNVRQSAEDVYENFNQRQSQDYLPAGSEECALPDSPSTSRHKAMKSVSSNPEEKPLLDTTDEMSEGEIEDDMQEQQLNFPTLALTPYQFSMIQALDNVGWKKYPVWIHKVRHSHAAVIVRMNRWGFGEGKIVVKHWLSGFEI